MKEDLYAAIENYMEVLGCLMRIQDEMTPRPVLLGQGVRHGQQQRWVDPLEKRPRCQRAYRIFQAIHSYELIA